MTSVFAVPRTYHRIAWMTRRQGADAPQAMLDKVADIQRTGAKPEAMPCAAIPEMIDQRPGR